jgi:hypothetical protein
LTSHGASIMWHDGCAQDGGDRADGRHARAGRHAAAAGRGVLPAAQGQRQLRAAQGHQQVPQGPAEARPPPATAAAPRQGIALRQRRGNTPHPLPPLPRSRRPSRLGGACGVGPVLPGRCRRPQSTMAACWLSMVLRAPWRRACYHNRRCASGVRHQGPPTSASSRRGERGLRPAAAAAAAAVTAAGTSLIHSTSTQMTGGGAHNVMHGTGSRCSHTHTRYSHPRPCRGGPPSLPNQTAGAGRVLSVEQRGARCQLGAGWAAGGGVRTETGICGSEKPVSVPRCRPGCPWAACTTRPRAVREPPVPPTATQSVSGSGQPESHGHLWGDPGEDRRGSPRHARNGIDRHDKVES